MENLNYIQNFVSTVDANTCLNEILQYNFHRVPTKAFGKKSFINLCLFADEDHVAYTCVNTDVPSLPWTPLLCNLKTAVEAACQSTFNCALIQLQINGETKTNLYEEVNATAPSAILSLGATRTLQFTRKKFKSVNLPLENGSLLIRNIPNENVWSCVLPSEPDVKESRIVVSFYKIEKDCEEMFIDDAMDSFFNSITASQLDPTTVPMPEIKPDTAVSLCNETLFKKNLGDNIFVSFEHYKSTLKIHIRLYVTNENGELYATRSGVTLDLPTWYHFHRKLVNFNLCYVTTSFIANNSVFVLNLKDSMHIQVLNVFNSKQPFIRLSHSQIFTLKETVYEMNDLIINFLFNKRLPYFIQCERNLLSTLSSEEEDVLMLKLIECFENALSIAFLSVFECNGCIIDHPSQLQHSCISLTQLEKYQCLGDSIFLLVNMEVIASEFVNSVGFISESFLSNVSPHVIKDVVFKGK